MVLGVQYADAVTDDATALADYWPQIRQEFPHLEKQPPLLPASEEFGAKPRESRFQFEVLQSLTPQRYWFSDGGNWLVQVQQDRFILNWRRREPTDVYPRYRAIRRRFEELFRPFVDGLDPERLAKNPPTWCEVTYINQIDAAAPSDASKHVPLSRILRLVKSPRSSVLLPPEETQFQQRHIIPSVDEGGDPAGRLYLTAIPALRAADSTAIYSLTLLARARPDGKSRAAILRSFDQGRDRIVRTFKEITTERMHKKWKLR